MLLDNAGTLCLEEILMDCADEANLNIVREKFKNSTIKLNNGKIVKMNSPEALNMIILPYLLNGNHELAMNITEQFGLQE